MSDGKVHEKATLSLAAIFWLIFHQPLVALGMALSLMIGPDLDLAARPRGSFRPRIASRWDTLMLGWLWVPYARLCPSHRHWFSHAPIISTVIRLTYLLVIILVVTVPIYIYFWGEGRVFPTFKAILQMSIHVVPSVFIGLVVSDTLHFVMDIISSMIKKLR